LVARFNICDILAEGGGPKCACNVGATLLFRESQGQSRSSASLELRKKLEGVTYGVGRNFCFKCFLAIAEILHYILVSIERL